MNDLSSDTLSAAQGRTFTADDYTYQYPDIWLLDDDNIWTMMHRAYIARVVDLVRDSGAKTVIDVGCGDGWSCGQMVAAGLDTVGIDWSKNGIEHAKRLAPGAQFMCCDVKDPAFTERFPTPFDAATFVEVIEHIPPDDCVEALRNVRDLVKVGGRVVLTTPSVNFPNDNDTHYRHFTKDILTDLITQAGNLKIHQIEGYGDVQAEDRHWARARWVHNRYYTIYPALRHLNRQYAPHCIGTPLDRCHGFIVTMERV